MNTLVYTSYETLTMANTDVGDKTKIHTKPIVNGTNKEECGR